jgi:hypothetical protein
MMETKRPFLPFTVESAVQEQSVIGSPEQPFEWQLHLKQMFGHS